MLWRWQRRKLRSRTPLRTARKVKSRQTYQVLEPRNLLALVWTSGPSLDSPRSEAVAILGADSAIHILGGQGTSAEFIAPGDFEWSPGPAIDKQRVALGGGPLGDGRILIFGGRNANDPIEESYRYDPTDSDPQDAASLAGPRAHAAFATDPASGLIYAIGGIDADGALLNTVEIYNQAADSWSPAASLPDARADVCAAADGQGHIFVFGGRRAGYGSNDATADVFRYDMATNSWQAMASMPMPLRDQVAVTGPHDGRIYLVGGRTPTNTVVGNVLAYDFGANAWIHETSLANPVADAAATLDSEGRLWVVGGRTDTGLETATVQVSQDLDAEDLSPTITSTPELQATVSVVYSYPLFATGNPQPEFTLVESPAGMTLSANGLILWTPDESQVGTVSVQVRASNRAGFDDQSFVLEVISAIPRITTQPPTIGGTLQAYQYDVDASGNPPPVFALLTAPAGMTLDPGSGQISWTPTAQQFGSHAVSVIAMNTHGSATQSFTIEVADRIAPTIPTGLLVAGVSQTDVTLTWQAASDNAAVTKYRVYEQYKYGWRNSKTGYRLVQDHVPATSTTVTGLTVGKTYKYVVRAADAAGNESLNSNLVQFTTLKLPTVTGPNTVNGIATHPLTAWRYYGSGTPLPTLSLESGPEGLVFDPSTGYAHWTPSDEQVGSHLLTIRATNSEGSVTKTTTITVTANLPVIGYTFSYMGKPYSIPFAVEGDPFQLQLTETFSQSAISWSLVSGPMGMTVDSVSGAVAWVPGADDVGTGAITIRATNYAGSQERTFSFTVHPLGTDLDPPAAVQGISVSVIDYNRAQIAWASTTDNVAVESYQITAYYTYQSRGTHTVRYTFSAPGDANNLEMTGLPTRVLKAYVRAVDAAGNLGPIGEIVTFTPSSNPNFPSIRLLNPLPTDAVAGQTHRIDLVDSNSQPRTYSFLSAPAEATIDPLTGRIQWTSQYADVGRAQFTIRATNAYGYRDFTFSFNVYFTGPVQSLSYTRNTAWNSARVSWTPPADSSRVAGYLVYQYWQVNGHTYSHVYRIDSPTQTDLDVFVVGGPVVHMVQVAAFDSLGNLSLVTPKIPLI